MTFLAYIARFLFWLLVASWAIRLLRRFVGWMLSSAATAGQQTPEAASAENGRAARRLVRDPICGMHVDETLSVPFRNEGELLHFCSNTCRDKKIQIVSPDSTKATPRPRLPGPISDAATREAMPK